MKTKNKKNKVIPKKQFEYEVEEVDEDVDFGNIDLIMRGIKSKKSARDFAIHWQNYIIHSKPMSYSEMINSEILFTKLGKKYNLVREFKNNGII